MAKTYGTVTTFTAGSVLTAAQLNVASTAVNNLVVPPSAQVQRTTNLTSYTAGADISWSSATFDTDGMFSAGSPTQLTVQTSGLYLVSLFMQLTCAATLTQCTFDIYVGGALAMRMFPAVASTTSYGSTSHIMNLTASNVVTFRANPVGGSAYVISGDSTTTNNQSRCALTWIGRTS